MKKLVIILLFLPVLILVTSGQYIHVDRNYQGTSNNGSLERPYTTIQIAVDSSKTGTTIFIHEGVYREQVELKKDSLTFLPYQNKKVVVTGTDAITEWEQVAGSNIYKATMEWDVNEAGQNNQVFVDGKMLHLARWPKEMGDDLIVEPTLGIMDDASKSGELVVFEDMEFTEPATRWIGSQVWLNSSGAYNGHGYDGEGWTGKITGITGNSLEITSIGASKLNAGDDQHYAAKEGTEYYLFNPDTEAVRNSGGVSDLLAEGEWWKDSTTLYVRLPGDKVPANTEEGNNLVEAKKRIWAFAPEISKETMSNIVVRNIGIFGAAVTTDRSYVTRRDDPAEANNNVFEGINFRHIFHTTDLTGHTHQYWMQRSGIIISGSDNKVKDCKFDYSAAAAISAIGYRHKIIGNTFTNINYHVTETGTICAGARVNLYDPEIAYNTFINCPHKAIALAFIRCSWPEVNPGSARMHHNLIDGFCLRARDCGAFNASAGQDWTYLRIDHNHIFNCHTLTTAAIYFDFGAHAIVDHNVIDDVDRGILFNIFSEGQGPRGPFHVYNNVVRNTGNNPSIQISDRDNTADVMFIKNNIVRRINGSQRLAEKDSNIVETDTMVFNSLFVDPGSRNFYLKSTATRAINNGITVIPYNDLKIGASFDIGAYEFGLPPWGVGADTNLVSTSSGIVRIINSSKSLKIFPNPVTDELNLQFIIDKSEFSRNDFRIIITDLQSRLVYRKNIYPVPNFNHYKIDMSTLSGGMYVVAIQGTTNIYLKKFIKTK